MAETTAPGQAERRITVYSSLEAAEPVWRAAEGHLALYGFQTFDWIATWMQTVGAPGGLRPLIVVVASPDDRVVMLLPLTVERRDGLSFLRFLAYADYNAPLICPVFAAGLDARSFRALWADILARLPRVDVVTLHMLPALIEDVANPLLWLSQAERRTESHAARLSGSMAAFQQGRSPKLIADTRRQRRRLAQLGPVSFVIAEDPADIRTVVHEMARQKARWMHEMGGPDAFDPASLAFCETMALRHAGGLIQASALRVGEKIVATHWGMVFRGRFYYLFPAYEGGEWAKYSVGRLLMENLIEWCILNQVGVFDMTVGQRTVQAGMGGPFDDDP